MEEGPVLPVQVAHEVLGAFGKIHDGGQIDDLPADVLPLGIFLRQQIQILLPVALPHVVKAHIPSPLCKRLHFNYLYKGCTKQKYSPVWMPFA